MDRSKLKAYAPQARRDFIQAMKTRAAQFGITEKGVTTATLQGDVALIQGQAFPRYIEEQRLRLAARIDREGFEQVMEAMAYTWFNRFAALRYMELHGYLDHGYRVLSHPEGKPVPEILEHAEHVELPGIKVTEVVDLKLEGKEQELYRRLLVAQCNALHWLMPFLFEAIEDETELLLPVNLLHSDSVLRSLVANLDSEDCGNVEVLGWLYQFYIAERKDAVMARKNAVPTEDIPAVTQLFTPHWIVRYLVENSLGRLWLLNHPGSGLKVHMPYYLEGESEPDYLRIEKPEDIRLLDPACGSGHMLLYAFDLLMLIYEESGYAPNDIPALILRHNLYGLEICPRATQLTGLALVLKAREKSRRFLQPERIVQPSVLELQNVRFEEGELREYIRTLGLGDLFSEPLIRLLHQFEEAKTFGSLIQPSMDGQAIAEVRRAIVAKNLTGHIFLRDTHLRVIRLLEQAEALTQRYHVVVANPPYMGDAGYNSSLKHFVENNFREGMTDLYGAFILRNLQFVIPKGLIGMITIPNWMFIQSFEQLRGHLLHKAQINSLIFNGRGVWGSDFGSCSFIVRTFPTIVTKGVFKRLFKKQGEVNSNEELLERFLNHTEFPIYSASTQQFRMIPGSPIAFWVTDEMRLGFTTGKALSDCTQMRKGLATGENGRFLRLWHEVSQMRFGPNFSTRDEASRSGRKWFPHNKGGEARKWFGNLDHVINWENDGAEIRNFRDANGRLRSRPQNLEYSFKQALTWSKITIGAFTARFCEGGCLFDDAAAICHSMDSPQLYRILPILNSKVGIGVLQSLNPTVNLQIGDISRTPVIELETKEERDSLEKRTIECISIARADWNNFETSWNFQDYPLLRTELRCSSLESSWQNWHSQCTAAIRCMQALETDNNRLFINAYGLNGELQPEVPEDQITLARADAPKDMAALISYALGCMMGRYSLDKPGLIYAQAGNVDFNSENYTIFPADDDGIVPVTEFAWFPDDVALRFEVFVKTTWSAETLEENLAWVAEHLGSKKGESYRETIRRYFTTGFYKDHLQIYKKRPIYWLFRSGKERAFQALVYLHRYHEGTLARMRTEYVIPLQGRIGGRIEQLREDISRATSAAHGKQLQKEMDTLRRQEVELRAFDEQLHHYAELKINLDLDDGVKVNYGKFGDLLAEVKAITGGKEEE